jgi:hypothetical protein
MTRQHRPSPTQRDLALSRLHQLTAGMTVAGLAAVGGLGYLAALHNSGTAAAVASTTTTNSASTTDDATSSASGTSADSSSTTSDLQASSVGITSSSGSGQVTTGGS